MKLCFPGINRIVALLRQKPTLSINKDLKVFLPVLAPVYLNACLNVVAASGLITLFFSLPVVCSGLHAFV